MAELKCRQKLRADEEYYYKKIIEYYPDDYEGYYQIGKKYEREGLWYIDMKAHRINFKDYGEKKRKIAKEYFLKALQIEPENSKLYYTLGIHHIKDKDWQKVYDLMMKSIEFNPENKNAFLVLGYTCMKMQKYDEAEKSFKNAEKLMSEQERILFNDYTTILKPSKILKIEKTLNRNNLKKKLLDLYWKEKDPSFLTEYNERLLEHYSRFALANILFSIPDLGVEGWNSDRGKVLIRYGEPEFIYRNRPAMIAEPTKAVVFDAKGLLGKSSVIYAVEFMVYKDFMIVFEDPFLTRDYKLFEPPFDPFKQEKPLSALQRMIEFQPELFESEYDRKKVPVISYNSQFRNDNGETIIELYFSMPTNKTFETYYSGYDGKYIRIQEGIFLFNKDWEKIDSGINYKYIKINNASENSIIQSYLSLNAKPDFYNVAVEFIDNYRTIFGSNRETLECYNFNTGELTMSDLVLGVNSQESLRIPLRLRKQSLEPVPGLKFNKDKKVKLYFEVYNLTYDKNNKSKVELTASISFDREKTNLYKKALETVKKLAGKEKKQIEMSITSSFRGNSINDKIVQLLDISSLLPGFYVLNIKIRDLNTNKEVSRKRNIEIF